MQSLLTRIAPLAAIAFFNIGLASAQVIEPDRAHPAYAWHHALPKFTMWQRATIYGAMMAGMKEKPATPLPVDMQAQVGTKLPEAAALRPLPDTVAAQIPAAKKYQYAVWNSQVLLIDAADKTVTDILHDYILREKIPQDAHR
jgi:Protein of unknown function (DUF1236)